MLRASRLISHTSPATSSACIRSVSRSYTTMLSSVSYDAPDWAACLRNAPVKRLQLGHFPTPILPLSPPGLPDGVKLYMKRDDFSGLETSGNKIRKLEFIMQDALDAGADCIVTCGGVQSNHCRATAAVARMFGLDSYLLLRSNNPDEDPGLVGNVLFNKMIGAHSLQMSRQEYGKFGADNMIEKTCERLRAEGKKPYAIPVGGSNGLGTWGYLEAVGEMQQQIASLDVEFSDIAFACGSGGTAAGIGLGSYLYAQEHSDASLSFDKTIPVHAYIVCDKPEYFYSHIDDKILPEMGVPKHISSRQFLQITNAQGVGYARSTKQELSFVRDVARSTGVLMDPVYSGKALFHLLQELNASPDKFAGSSILFLHTGGQFGMYDKEEQLKELVADCDTQRFQMN